MHKVMVTGAGKIGSLIACLLADSKSYQVHLVDVSFNGSDVMRLLALRSDIKTVAMDVTDQQLIENYLKKHSMDAVISSLPFFFEHSCCHGCKGG